MNAYRLFPFLCSLIFLSSCKTSIQTTTTDNGKISYTTYNINQTKKPLAVVMPEVQSDVFSVPLLTKLSKKYRIIYLPFEEENNPERQIQIDGLGSRISFYGTELPKILHNQNASPDVFIAEGFNSLIVIPMASAYKATEVFLVNGFNQTLHNVIITNCFGADTSACLNLINHLQLNNFEKLNELLQFSYTASYDANLGNYSSNFWLEVMNYNITDQLPYFKGNLLWIYFVETGLVRKVDIEKFNTTNNKSHYQLTTNKLFFEKPKSFISN
jgi:hypothetical protein